MKRNLIIRADATVKIGTGHVMRCIALAQAWQGCGGKVTFLRYCDSIPLKERIRNEGFEFIAIKKPHPDPSYLNQTLTVLTNKTTQTNSIWVVIDGYHFTPKYQKAIRDAGKTFSIEDVLAVMDDHPHLHSINAYIVRKDIPSS